MKVKRYVSDLGLENLQKGWTESDPHLRTEKNKSFSHEIIITTPGADAQAIRALADRLIAESTHVVNEKTGDYYQVKKQLLAYYRKYNQEFYEAVTP